MRAPPDKLPKHWRKLKSRPLVSIIIPVTEDLQDALCRLRRVEKLQAVEIIPVWLREDEPPIEFYEAYMSNGKAWRTRVLNEVCAESAGDFILIIEEGASAIKEGIENMIQQFGDFRVGLVGQELCMDGHPHIRRGCLMMARKAYEECGFFNPHMHSNGWNGVEITLRLQKAGYGTRQAQSRDIDYGEPEQVEGKYPKRNADYIKRRYGVTV